MNKPAALRDYLLAGLPALKAAPERLEVRVAEGRVIASYGPGLAFQYAYSLKLTLLDFVTGDQDRLFALIVTWLGRYQRELLQNAELAASAVTFEVDDLGGGKVDLEITIPLTEGVVAELQEGGGYQLTSPIEPPADLDIDAPSVLHEIWGNAELLMACPAHHPPED